jgi:hypothetical protein
MLKLALMLWYDARDGITFDVSARDTDVNILKSIPSMTVRHRHHQMPRLASEESTYVFL